MKLENVAKVMNILSIGSNFILQLTKKAKTKKTEYAEQRIFKHLSSAKKCALINSTSD